MSSTHFLVVALVAAAVVKNFCLFSGTKLANIAAPYCTSFVLCGLVLLIVNNVCYYEISYCSVE